MSSRRRGSRRAFSFVEVAMATLFLALALVPLIDAVLSGSRRAQEDKMRVCAGVLASSVLERYRLEEPGSCAAAIAGAESDPALRPADAPEGWEALRGRFDVQPDFTSTGSGGVLSVEVSWSEKGRERSLRLQTFLTPPNAPGSP